MSDPILVGAMDLRDMAAWVEMAVDYVQRYPESVKEVLQRQAQKLGAPRPLLPEELDKLIQEVNDTGVKFLDAVTKQVGDVEMMIAQAQAKNLGKENMN